MILAIDLFSMDSHGREGGNTFGDSSSSTVSHSVNQAGTATAIARTPPERTLQLLGSR